MDSLEVSGQTADALRNMSDKDKQELQQFVNNETQKAQIQQTVHNLTDLCFRKCITGKISSGALDRSEEPCMQNCVDRWMDSQMTVVRRLESLQHR
ncbi:Mitochondrial import inner membrane translocase subunit tim8 [Acrodontium crateriforme]|uniref:Mitochondrial import inner membrane translocase subunit n=1 Tax=Acrodontium crateriforme TaxID=150365 RepID=A0AAQ3R7J7_9PEZI|nr:Mitochondrial import inner membrane translocase subunit tim8 [Acrodontium crateriforme]